MVWHHNHTVQATFASEITLADDVSSMTVVREIDGGLETISVDLPVRTPSAPTAAHPPRLPDSESDRQLQPTRYPSQYPRRASRFSSLF